MVKSASRTAMALAVSGLLISLGGQTAAAEPKPAPPPVKACNVRLGPVHDLRADPETMGDLYGKPIQGKELPAWLSYSFEVLGHDPHINLVGADAKEVDVDLSVDILKAYLMATAMAKSANVVVRVHFTGGAVPAEDHVYRGIDSGVNWVGSQAESKGAMSRALTELVTQVHTDLTRRCAAATSPAAPAG